MSESQPPEHPQGSASSPEEESVDEFPLGEHIPFTGVQDRHAVDFALLTTRQNQVQLNQMADTKANIMITVSSVVFSVVLSQLDKPELRIPLLTMGATALVALVLAILAVLPRVSVPRTPDGEIDTQSANFNLFFFGHFAAMSYREYHKRMERLLRDDAQLYERLVADIYGLGAFLSHHKFRYLRWSYIALIIGVVITGVEVVAITAWGLL